MVWKEGAALNDDEDDGEDCGAVVVGAELEVEYTPQAGVYDGIGQSVGIPVKVVLKCPSPSSGVQRLRS